MTMPPNVVRAWNAQIYGVLHLNGVNPRDAEVRDVTTPGQEGRSVNVIHNSKRLAKVTVHWEGNDIDTGPSTIIVRTFE